MTRWIVVATGFLRLAECDSEAREESHAIALGTLTAVISPCSCHADSRRSIPSTPGEKMGEAAEDALLIECPG